jgi:hypothetical protein
MPNTILLPNGVGSHTQWTNGTLYTRLQSADGDTSIMTIARTSAGYNSAHVDSLPSAAAYITDGNCTSLCQGRRSGTGTKANVYTGIRYSGTTVLGSFYLFDDIYRNVSTAHTTVPGVGGKFTVAIINLCETVFYNDGTGSANDNRVTYAYLSANWNYGGGASASFIASLVGPLLGAAIQLKDMPGISWAMSKVRPKGVGMTHLNPEEYRPHWDALRTYTWPVQFDLAAV